MAERWLRAVGDDEWHGPRAYGEGGSSPAGGPRECACDGCVADIMAGLGRGRHGYEGSATAGYGGGDGGGGAPGRLTRIALVDGHVVDVRVGPVRGSRYEYAAYELQARGQLQPEPAPRTVTIRQPPHEAMLDWLARVVGGEEALGLLDATPLPADEELDLSAVPGWARERARLVDELVQAAWGHELVGPELLTACRRLLVRAAGVQAFEMWRDTRPEQIAATIVHCMAKANALTGVGRGFAMKDLIGGIGVKGYPTHRAKRLASLLGGEGWPHGAPPREAPEVYVLGDPGLLVSQFRSELLAYHRHALALEAAAG